MQADFLEDSFDLSMEEAWACRQDNPIL
jgi:hypothetical protein